jgi:hypothetical protein
MRMLLVLLKRKSIKNPGLTLLCMDKNKCLISRFDMNSVEISFAGVTSQWEHISVQVEKIPEFTCTILCPAALNKILKKSCPDFL